MPRSFNGTSDLIVADAAGGFSEQLAYSIAGWVKAATPASGPRTFYSEGRSSSANPFIWIGCNGANRDKLAFTVRNDGGGGSQVNASGTTQSSSALIDGTWHHFVYAQDGAGTCAYAVYIDGALDATLHGTYTSGATTINELTLGAFRRNTNSQFMVATLAHFGVWHRQLSAKEAASLAAGLLPPALGADHYWPLWGADSPEPDVASSSTDGTLTGTSLGAAGPPVCLSMLELAA